MSIQTTVTEETGNQERSTSITRIIIQIINNFEDSLEYDYLNDLVFGK